MKVPLRHKGQEESQPSQGGRTGGREVRTGEGIQREGLGIPWDSSFIYEAIAGLTSSQATA